MRQLCNFANIISSAEYSFHCWVVGFCQNWRVIIKNKITAESATQRFCFKSKNHLVVVSNIFIFIPTWENYPIWRSYFLDRWKPPTIVLYLIHVSSVLNIGVSKNRGIYTPKWMVCNGKSYLNGWFEGIPIFGNTHILYALPFLQPFRISYVLSWTGTISRCFSTWSRRGLAQNPMTKLSLKK